VVYTGLLTPKHLSVHPIKIIPFDSGFLLLCISGTSSEIRWYFCANSQIVLEVICSMSYQVWHFLGCEKHRLRCSRGDGVKFCSVPVLFRPKFQQWYGPFSRFQFGLYRWHFLFMDFFFFETHVYISLSCWSLEDRLCSGFNLKGVRIVAWPQRN